jgi:hypothetical protein
MQNRQREERYRERYSKCRFYPQSEYSWRFLAQDLRKQTSRARAQKRALFFRENSLFHQLSPLFARSAVEKTAQRLFYYERIKTNCTSVCVPPSLSRERERAEQSFLYSNSLHIITYNNFCAAAVVIITIKKAIVDTSRGCFGAADVRQMRPSSSF